MPADIRNRKRPAASHPYGRKENVPPAKTVLNTFASLVVKPLSWIFNSGYEQPKSTATDTQMEEKDDEKEPSPLKAQPSVPAPKTPAANGHGADVVAIKNQILGMIQSGKKFTPEEFEQYTRQMRQQIDAEEVIQIFSSRFCVVLLPRT